MYHYTFYKVTTTGQLINREELNDNEVEQFVSEQYGKVVTFKLVRSDGNYIIYTDDGDNFVVSEKGKM